MVQIAIIGLRVITAVGITAMTIESTIRITDRIKEKIEKKKRKEVE